MITYNKESDENIVNDMFAIVADNGKAFNKTSWYMQNNVKVNINSFVTMLTLSAAARRMLSYIIIHLKYNTNVISIDRQDVAKFFETKNQTFIGDGLKELLEVGFIKPSSNGGKNDFVVPMNNIVRGNIDEMMREIKHREQQEEIAKKEQLSIKSYTELSFKRKIKQNESKN